MDWLRTLTTDAGSVQTSLFVLAAAITLGLVLGAARVRGFRFGVAGVLFSGLLLAHLGLRVDPMVLEFVREFGLVLFVYAVGLAVGPGFFASLRKHGLKLNALAVAIVFLGVGASLGGAQLARAPMPAAVGVFCGATTNTPSLAAAGQALRDHPPDPDRVRAPFGAPDGSDADTAAEIVKIPGLAYAVTYPFGVIGVLLTMTLLRRVFRADPHREADEIERESGDGAKAREQLTLRVTNPNLEGLALAKVPGLAPSAVVISRVGHAGKVSVPTGSTRLHVGDTLLAVGPREELDALRVVVGEEADRSLLESNESDITLRWLTVSRKSATGRSVRALGLGARLGVRVTRVRRAQVELPPHDEVLLRPGDEVLVVGSARGVAMAAKEVGDSRKRLEEPELTPIFIGLLLGVVAGSIPIALPGLPTPVKLGLAGGPLIVAMVLARVLRVGPVVWYLPRSASLILKDLGITLFLAAVGLKAGDRFAEVVGSAQGLKWLAMGAVVTMLPPMLVGAFALGVLRLRYLTVCGLLAGSMTDPPSLAFANAQADSEAPSVAYAAVYPLTMIFRVIAAQAMILWWVL